MSKTIKRGAPARRPVQPQRRQTRQTKRSSIDRAIALLPVSEATLRRAATLAILALVLAVSVTVGAFFGVPQAIGVAAAEQVGKAGFRVEGIEITGAKRMNAMTVYAVVLEQQSRAMPLVDLEGVRQKLLGYGWIADAQVSRRLPDKLVVNIVEREPAAVWQNHGQLTLIDANGVLLEPVALDKMPDLPLVIGEGANLQTPAYRALLDSAPALRPLVRAATWVGNRRWNLTFETGETLVLPEEEPTRALVKFAELDGARPLLGKGWLRFDMRDPTRLVVRKPGAETQRAITDTSESQPIVQTAMSRGTEG
ncbi:MAG: cell division protein FtsQ [Sphingomonas sp. 28-66-16]|nr:MAG: cell division protein FtsQ [Sphingomonas sp. 28-66-16]